jgi:hypothetical protein
MILLRALALFGGMSGLMLMVESFNAQDSGVAAVERIYGAIALGVTGMVAVALVLRGRAQRRESERHAQP